MWFKYIISDLNIVKESCINSCCIIKQNDLAEVTVGITNMLSTMH